MNFLFLCEAVQSCPLFLKQRLLDLLAGMEMAIIGSLDELMMSLMLGVL
jgi:hypothetical protein